MLQRKQITQRKQKRQPKEWEKIFENYLSDKLVPRKYKEFLKSTIKTQSN